jgi:hypothetical protein
VIIGLVFGICPILVRGCLVPFFFQKKGFGSSFCKMELNSMQIFLAKRWLFSILYFSLKRQKKRKPKFCILDGTKHDPKNFAILHFIITPK